MNNNSELDKLNVEAIKMENLSLKNEAEKVSTEKETGLKSAVEAELKLNPKSKETINIGCNNKVSENPKTLSRDFKENLGSETKNKKVESESSEVVKEEKTNFSFMKDECNTVVTSSSAAMGETNASHHELDQPAKEHVSVNDKFDTDDTVKDAAIKQETLVTSDENLSELDNFNPKEVFFSPPRKPMKSFIDLNGSGSNQEKTMSTTVQCAPIVSSVKSVSSTNVLAPQLTTPVQTTPSLLMGSVDPVLYQAVLAQLLQVYPQLATNPSMLTTVALQQTGLVQMYMQQGNQTGVANAVTSALGVLEAGSISLPALAGLGAMQSGVSSQLATGASGKTKEDTACVSTGTKQAKNLEAKTEREFEEPPKKSDYSNIDQMLPLPRPPGFTAESDISAKSATNTKPDISAKSKLTAKPEQCADYVLPVRSKADVKDVQKTIMSVNNVDKVRQNDMTLCSNFGLETGDSGRKRISESWEDDSEPSKVVNKGDCAKTVKFGSKANSKVSGLDDFEDFCYGDMKKVTNRKSEVTFNQPAVNHCQIDNSDKSEKSVTETLRPARDKVATKPVFKRFPMDKDGYSSDISKPGLSGNSVAKHFLDSAKDLSLKTSAVSNGVSEDWDSCNSGSTASDKKVSKQVM